MRTRTLTGRPAVLLDAQIAFRRLEDRLLFRVHHERTVFIPNLDHTNGIVRTIVRADRAPNAGGLVDHDLPAKRCAMDRTRGTADHTNRVGTMHAGIGHHHSSMGRPVSKKTRIVIVGGRAGAHAIVTPRATIQVDQHRGRAIEETVLGEEFEQVRTEFRRGVELRRF